MYSYIDEIKSSCAYVANHSQHVAISDDNILELATKMTAESKANGGLKFVNWDDHGWHYVKDVSQSGPLTAQYVFVLDSLNFCFWPCDLLEYEVIASNLTRVLMNDSHAFEADRLIKITTSEIASWFPGYQIPLLEERVDRLQELGYGLLNHEFNGLAANVVIKANGSCVKLVELLLMYFPGFRDTTLYNGRLVHFYKRAQILVGDIWAAYGCHTDPTHPYHIRDIHELTMFADYRVPQILREYKVLQYTPELSSKIDRKVELISGSQEEVEIRAATVVAVERLQKACSKLGLNMTSIELDWLLWQEGENTKSVIAPHHRTLSIYY